MADVESLELKITSSAKDAEQGLDTLIETLGRLREATKGGFGLTSIATSIEKIGKATNSLNESTGAKLSGLASGLSALSGVGKINMTSFVKQLEKIPDVAEKLDKANLADFNKNIRELAEAMAPLATQMEKVSNGFSKLPDRINQVVNANTRIPSTNNKSALSFAKLATNIGAVWLSLRRIGTAIGSWIAESNDYNENMNLFNVSMGKYTWGAERYAKKVSEAMGIDPSEWVRNQGVFMTLGKGFGIAGDRANHMSQQLTQLGYDLSSFYNIDVEEAMDKLKSGFSGELEPLRNLGYDLSKAKLEAVALSLGIDKAFDSMTQAEKAELRYQAVLEQVSWVQGDMARTLDEPANMIRVLTAQAKQAAQALGNIFIPALKAILPWAIAVVKVVRILANAIAGLFGYEMKELDYSAMNDLGSSASGASDAIGEAASNAGKLKKMLLGIDELNVMSDSSGSGSDSASTGGGFNFDLAKYQEKFIDDSVSEQINGIVEKMKEWLGITGEIDSWSDLFNTSLGNIATEVGIIGGAFLAWKISTSVIDGINALKNFSSAHGTTAGIIGGVAGVATAGLGLATIINELSDNWEAIKNGDWSGVDKVMLAIGAIELLGGVATAIASFNSIKKKLDTTKTIENLTDVATVTDTVNTTTSSVTQKLGDLAKNLALGIAIIAEVAVAAILIVGAIWVLGKELEQVGIAWEPVIANGNTILIAMGIGTATLVAVGVATGLLGTLGGAMCGQIGIGIAILAELGVAAALFILEIWAIGKGLDEIGKAWKPVLDNGETIERAIAKGTELLIAIGVVAAALGVATVATAGALPLAIGLGTLLLVELGVAFIEFTDSLIDVAEQLSDDLHPAFVDTNAKLPTLSRNMANFTDFMKEFAQEVVDYTKVGVISGIAGTVNKVVDFFTEDPIKRLANEVEDQGDKMQKLVDRLNEVNPIIQDAHRLMGEFNDAMKGLKATTGVNGTTPGSIGYTITIGVQLAKSGWTSVKDWIGDLTTTLKIKLPHVSVSWVDTGKGEVEYPKFNVSYYAQGGFPSVGEVFVSREAGPELVGTIGNRSAVVNNDQIVESVSRGVYQAVVSAMGSSGGDRVVEAKVNDKVLFEVLVSRARQETVRTGHNPLLGGV